MLKVAIAMSMPSTIPDSQLLQGPEFQGSPVAAHPIKPKVQFQPASSLMHQDTGNTGSTDLPGPLGYNLTLGSSTLQLGVFLWGSEGTLYGGCIDNSTSQIQYGIGVYDPDTLATTTRWFPDNASIALNYGYMQLRLHDESLVTSNPEGQIFILRRDTVSSGNLTMVRQIELGGTIQPGEVLMNSMYDATGNVWYTTGELNYGTQYSTTLGYVEPDGTIHKLHLPAQIVENGMAVNGTTMYVVTGPPTNYTSEATGYVWAFTTKPGTQNVTLVWRTPYDAGSGRKLGGLTRGGGSTPSLLGSEYLTTTDNADRQVALLVVHRDKQPEGSNQVFCRVPLFGIDASSSDIRPTVHFDGNNYGVSIINTFKEPPPQLTGINGSTINGEWNNMAQQPGGIVKVSVARDGCRIAWQNSLKMKSVPVLSTSTGLYYGHVQDEGWAVKGIYEWYAVAMSWATGEVVWRQRTGAGGTYNDNQFQAAIGPDNRLYQANIDGVVWLADSESK